MPATLMAQRILGGSELRHTSPEPDPIFDGLPFRPVRTPEEIERDRAQSRAIARASLELSQAQAAKWLARPCAEHHAKSGEFCWPFVGGLCGERIGAAS